MSAVPSRYATCERAWAAPTGPNHLRVLAVGEELRVNGIVSTRAALTLCGRDATGGWDLAEADADTIARLATPREGDGHVWLCAFCHAAWLDRERGA